MGTFILAPSPANENPNSTFEDTKTVVDILTGAGRYSNQTCSPRSLGRGVGWTLLWGWQGGLGVQEEKSGRGVAEKRRKMTLLTAVLLLYLYCYTCFTQNIRFWCVRRESAVAGLKRREQNGVETWNNKKIAKIAMNGFKSSLAPLCSSQ